jgi:acyl carrier protein
MLNLEQIREAMNRACEDRDINSIPVDAQLRDLGFDSMDMFNIFLELEAISGRDIPDDDIELLTSIQAIQDYFDENMS